MKPVTKQFIFFLIMVLPMTGFSQKRVVLRDSAVTGALSRFLNNAEGWVRQNAQANDAIFLTGNFSNILRDTLRRKDSLIIIAHGSNFPTRGSTFTWFGNRYYDFGVGGAHDTIPIPANLNTRDSVRALMYTCFSGRSPDTAGNNTSLVSRLVAKLGANSSGAGFSDFCIAGSTITGNAIVFKNKKLTGKARGVLIDSSYAALRRNASYIVAPPCNRPGGQRNQIDSVNSILNAYWGDSGKVAIRTLLYKKPRNSAVRPADAPAGCDCTDCGYTDNNDEDPAGLASIFFTGPNTGYINFINNDNVPLNFTNIQALVDNTSDPVLPNGYSPSGSTASGFPSSLTLNPNDSVGYSFSFSSLGGYVSVSFLLATTTDPTNTYQEWASEPQAESTVDAIPTLSQWGLIALSVLVLCTGIFFVKRNS